MAKASDNPFPSILLEDHADPAAPSSGYHRLFVDTDETLKMIDHASAVTVIGTPAEITDIATADTTTTNVLAPNGTGGVEWRAEAGGSSIVRPALTPVTPTDDFNSSLSGWTAVSDYGSFDTSKCFAQAVDGSRLWLPFVNQHGYLYKSTTDIDQEWMVGGLVVGPAVDDAFFGIAILDASSDGVGLIYHWADKSCALISVTAGRYNGTPSAQVTPWTYGYTVGSNTEMWLRLTRVGNTWDGYASMSGGAWEGHVAGTMSKTITAARKCIGLFSTGTTGYQTMMKADWVHTA
jgi:hypothetical protein